MEATRKSPSKGKILLATENISTANKNMTQTIKVSNHKKVPKEIEATVKTTSGE